MMNTRLVFSLSIICVLLACSLPTPTPTPEPTATWTPMPPVPTATETPTITPTPTATLTPAPVLLPPYCIMPPVYSEVKAAIEKEHPGAEVPRDGALLWTIRFRHEGAEYMAMLGYKEGIWELIWIMPWEGGSTPTPTATATPWDGAGEAMK